MAVHGVHGRFYQLLRGASREELDVLSNFELYVSRACMYSPSTLSDFGILSDIPWPIAFLLTTYARKHIFASCRLPSHGRLQDSLNSFTRLVLT